MRIQGISIYQVDLAVKGGGFHSSGGRVRRSVDTSVVRIDTDAGLTGPTESIIGCSTDSVLHVFLSGMRARFDVAGDDRSAVMEGVILDVDPVSGRARAIERVRL